MTLYFLSYDKRRDGNYQQLYDELKRLNAKPLVESTWCMKQSGTSSAELRDHFGRFFDKDDGWIVSKVDGWASKRTQNTPKDL